MIGDRERAEDLVQEAFLRVHRHLDRFDPSRKFSTWIYTIASNLAKNELRNRSRSPFVVLERARSGEEDGLSQVDFEDSGTRPDDLYERRSLKALVDATVAKLASHHREVFVLRELEGKSYEEIAEIMHCNLGTVKSRLNRARQSFAELIQPHLE
jgi:RNA polymerase sigma-70 factor (ECF subfamily)